jgi:signal transduction histidine kinase
VTAHQEDRNVAFEGYNTGAVDLLFKPLDPYVVRTKVRVFVELNQQRTLLQEHVREHERLRVEAEAANIAKSQFLANMSHEIRTPLAAVMGFAEMIAGGEQKETEKESCMAAIKRNGELLLRLIDDILDLSKIEANRIELEKTELNLQEIFNEIDATLSFKAHEKGVALQIHRPDDAHLNYRSDTTRIKQILLNVIGNAIKFTPKGTIEVRVVVEPGEARTGSAAIDTVLITVHDEGVGLTRDQAERLFQPFGQADPSTRRHFGGSGLGLVISRQLARNLGGDIRLLDSQPGQGSIFEIRFSLERAAAKTLKPKSASVAGAKIDFSGKRILAVDDSVDNLTLIEMFLRGTRADLTFAGNGKQAIDSARNKKFDLVLMDIQMPGMDGHEATEEFRRMGLKIPIIALTAHATKSERERCRQSGCDEVLTKPITRSGLIEGISSYLT